MRTETPATLYNRFVDPATRQSAYSRVVLASVHWEDRKAANKVGTGNTARVDQASIFIPMTLGGLYLKPSQWRALVDHSTNWTLQPGDLIVRGVTDAEITADYTEENLRADNDSVLTITSVDAMDYGGVYLRHWKVGAE